ncbi:MAG TPA: SDR family oxidoreductase [Mucilaginibacter sp.]|jgi:nucleoside-diphosphate-sugar epimerase|nr:SDR family oxidoreductase [Mucilaginibacter sp.]
MVISILGCGWYGEALAVALLKKGLAVKGSVTSANKLEHLQAIGIRPYLIKFDADRQSTDPEFFRCDILVVSIPPKLKAGEGTSYPAKIQRIIDVCVRYLVKRIIYISSTGVYGDHNGEVDELTEPKPDTESGRILLEAEKLFLNEHPFKTTILRFGGLVGPGRHPGRFFAGKTDIANGLAPVNLVHLADCVAISMAIIEMDAFGHLFNAVSPDHPSKTDYYSLMTLRAGLPIPGFINELKGWKVVSSVNLERLLNYAFLFNGRIAQAGNI